MGNRHRLPHGTVAILALTLAFALGLTGCSNAPAGSSTPSPDATGYLYAGASELIFLHWDAERASSGTAFWHRGAGAPMTSDFSVTWGEGSFALNFEPGTMAGWTGTIAGTGLELLLPADDGTLRAVPLRSATFREYQGLAQHLE